MSIQRYLNSAITNYPLLPHKDGNFVRYADHLAEVARLQSEIDALRNQLRDTTISHSITLQITESNPDHLEPVPHRINKRRGAGVVLIQADVDAIRAMAAQGIIHEDIAKNFPVSRRHISDIVARRRWELE